MLNYNHLYYFYVTAQLESVTRAAQKLSIQQPSLSAQLKTFEEQLDQDLFQKVGRQIRLTNQGQIVYKYCQRIFEAADDLQGYLKNESVEQSAKITIGVTEQIDQTFIADLLSHMTGLRQQTGATRIISGDKTELVEQMRGRQIDLLITNSPSYGAEVLPFAELDMPMGLVVAKSLFQKHRKLEPAVKNWLQEKSLGLVLPSEKLKLRHEIDSYLQKFKVRSAIAFESDMMPVVARALVDGIGIGFMPIPYLIEEIKLGLVVTLNVGQPLWFHKLYMMVQPEQAGNPLLLAMKEQLSLFDLGGKKK